ncbi:MAG: DUF3427 domain-containing protein, partial [Tissierellia bacterium]|nr:DUF3427 domain-containing protein [Tissierellia bacterium]
FRAVLKDHNFGELMVGGIIPSEINNLFISIQTLNSKGLWNNVDKDFYDYIIIDEFHHAAADSYQKVLEYFEPKILLGLTATPERMDGKDILKYFNNKIAAEIRLPEAINRNLLVPFSYFGVSDDTDLTSLKWTRGGYDRSELSNVLSHNSARASLIINSLDRYLNDIEDVKGIGFCVSKEHAEYMSEIFNKANIKSIFLTSDSSSDLRNKAKDLLVSGEVKFIFVVDLYNEGVDIPEVNTVLFLRPTESLTIFLQQLGRGLRLHEGKDSLTVLDYVGQANKNYRFAEKYTALLSSSAGELSNEIKHGFPHLPKGCYIQLEKKAQEYVLENIKQSFNNKARFAEKFNEFESQSGLEISFENFFNYYNIHPAKMYKLNLSYSLLYNKFSGNEFVEDEQYTKFFARLSTTKSTNFAKVLLRLVTSIENGLSAVNEYEKTILLMLHYTMWQKSPVELGYNSVLESVRVIVDSNYYDELISLLKFNLDKIDILNSRIDVLSNNPLELYATYSRDQISAAFNICNEDRYFSIREGVWYSEEHKTDIFFITLNKSEKHYASAIRYNDYSINDEYFHWQSQNTTSETSNTGQRYINHKSQGSKVLLCVRDNRTNEFGLTENYTILGYADYVSHKDNRPMSIVWKLQNKIPAKFIEITSKLMVN